MGALLDRLSPADRRLLSSCFLVLPVGPLMVLGAVSMMAGVYWTGGGPVRFLAAPYLPITLVGAVGAGAFLVAWFASFLALRKHGITRATHEGAFRELYRVWWNNGWRFPPHFCELVGAARLPNSSPAAPE